MSRCRGAAVALSAVSLVLPTAASADAPRNVTGGTAPSDRFGARTLSEGVHGPDVRQLQRLLVRVGVDAEAEADGHYGPGTTRRVRSWERRSQRAVDGTVSRSDAAALEAQAAARVTVAITPPSSEQVDAVVDKPTLGPDGLAIAPPSAPAEVHALIAAANMIVGMRYGLGGGHGRWAIDDSVVDCSGAVSWALHGAGLLGKPLASGSLMKWKQAGRGDWITVLSNSDHVFLVIGDALRFDTGYHGGNGPRWSTEDAARRSPLRGAAPARALIASSCAGSAAPSAAAAGP